ncbi:MAG: Stp1/IreP family PP2C-type Ser/Thr phosphatase [Candidatus Acidiferrales bacterium]
MITARTHEKSASNRENGRGTNVTPSFEMKALDFSIFSDAGRVRQNNEDRAAAAPEINLFVLCDGMGGLEAGERASQIAVETVIRQCREAAAKSAPSAEALSTAIELANEKIFRAAQESGSKSGMGSTIVAVQFHGERAIIAHVGDSRVYRLRHNEFSQITEDHSFVAEQVRRGVISVDEASRSQLQNVLIRALGVETSVKVASIEELLLDGDTFLLCSDGLTRELSDSQISVVLDEADHANEAAARLVRLANEAGGEDNVTVVVVRNSKKAGGVRAKIGRWFKNSEDGI